MAADTPFTYWAWVDHVHDGDTVMVKLDMGLAHYLGSLPSLQAHDTVTYSIRLFGINSPELNSPDEATRKAAEAAKANLESLLRPGEYVKVVSRGWDKFKMRIDGVPYSPQGVDCCQAQLDGGFAVPYTV